MISLPDLASRLRARRALLVGSERAAVYEWRGGVAVKRALFEADDAGRQGFRRYLGEGPDIPFHLLVDVADEEHRQDSLPHVARRDRQALLKRKAARLFRDTGYCHYKLLGREATGRRDDRVLLSALANPGFIRQWLAVLEEARMPLAGICSLPLFSARLLQGVAGRHDGCRMLVSMQSVSGLRQTCFDDGELRFSRLAPLPGAQHAPLAEFIRDEVEKVLRYLHSRRATANREPVQLHLLFADALLRELQPLLKQQDAVTHHCCDLRDLVAGDEVQEGAGDPHSDAYFMQQLLRLRPANHYAGAAERHWFFLGRWRRGVAGAGMALLLGSAGCSALNVYSGVVSWLAGGAAEEQARRHAAEYELAGARLPQTPVEPSGLKAAVMAADGLVRDKTSPAALLTALGHSLSRFPSVRLTRLSWTVTGSPDTVFAAAGQIVSDGAPAALRASTDRGRYQTALIKGRIEPFGGNFRAAMDTINRLAEHLRDHELVYNAAVVALPLDTSSAAALQGNTRSRQQQAEFALRLVLESNRET